MELQLTGFYSIPLQNSNKLEWAELNQAETVRLPVNAKLRFQV